MMTMEFDSESEFSAKINLNASLSDFQVANDENKLNWHKSWFWTNDLKNSSKETPLVISPLTSGKEARIERWNY